MTTPKEALSQIYAMRESIAHGWKPNQDQQLALALADMLDEVKIDAERYQFLRKADPDGQPAVSEQVQNSWGHWFHRYLWEDDLDAVIDASMKEK